MSFISPIQSHHLDANTPPLTPVSNLNGDVNKEVVEVEKLSSTSENGNNTKMFTNTLFPKYNVKERYGPGNLKRDFM